MNGLNVRKIEIIVNDLLLEFDKESGKLQSEYDDNVARILEIEESIHNYKENEDIDFQVFSPRKIDNQNEEKIESMKREKENIEDINKSLYRQIKYYSDKKDKLKEILSVINEDRDMEQASAFDDITKVDEKILEYYDKVVSEDDAYPEEPENIGTEVKSGWRLIKEELDTPVEVESSVPIEENISNEEVMENLTQIKQEVDVLLDKLNDIMTKMNN